MIMSAYRKHLQLSSLQQSEANPLSAFFLLDSKINATLKIFAAGPAFSGCYRTPKRSGLPTKLGWLENLHASSS